MNSPHHPHHEHHDVHQQRLLWFFSFCNQRSSSSSSSSSSSCPNSASRRSTSRRKNAASRNKFAIQYQQQLQQQQRQSSNVFGRDLTEHTQLFSQDDSIPNIVRCCTKFIEKHGIIFGIYRLSGMRVNIHKLRQEFDKNPKTSMIDSDAISNDAHAVACVLKQYFRELPTPLLTFHMYEKFIELFKQSNNNQQQKQSSQNPASLEKQDSIIRNFDHDMEGDNNNIYRSAKTPTKQLDAMNKTMSKQSDNSTSTKPTTSSPLMTTKSMSSTPTQLPNTNPAIGAINQQPKRQSQFTSSVSDSQLISLSSVVTTTSSDITYQVNLYDLRRLLLQLPKAHYQTLKFLMSHLACIAANGGKTGMDSKNVAIVWAPNLLKPRELELSAGLETLQIIGLQAVITEQLIKHHEFLFQEEKKDSSLIEQQKQRVEIPKTDQLEVDLEATRSQLNNNSNNNPNNNTNTNKQYQTTKQPVVVAQNDQEKLETKAKEDDKHENKFRDENEENKY